MRPGLGLISWRTDGKGQPGLGATGGDVPPGAAVPLSDRGHDGRCVPLGDVASVADHRLLSQRSHGLRPVDWSLSESENKEREPLHGIWT